MKILHITDIHGYLKELTAVMKQIESEEYDILVCSGNLTDVTKIPEGFSHSNMADLAIQKLLVNDKPVLCIPGNHDPYEIIELFDDYGINLHNKVKTVRGIKFLGWGGAITPFNTIFEPTEEETTESLAKLGKLVDNNFVLVIHNPPKDTKQD